MLDLSLAARSIVLERVSSNASAVNRWLERTGTGSGGAAHEPFRLATAWFGRALVLRPDALSARAIPGVPGAA